MVSSPSSPRRPRWPRTRLGTVLGDARCVSHCDASPAAAVVRPALSVVLAVRAAAVEERAVKPAVELPVLRPRLRLFPGGELHYNGLLLDANLFPCLSFSMNILAYLIFDVDLFASCLMSIFRLLLCCLFFLFLCLFYALRIPIGLCIQNSKTASHRSIFIQFIPTVVHCRNDDVVDRQT